MTGQTFDADWARPRPDPEQLRRDVLLAGALALGTALSLTLYTIGEVYERPAPWWASVSFVVFSTAPLAFRRRSPLLVAVIIAAAFMLGMIARVPELLFGSINLFVAIYSAGAWARHRGRAMLVRGGIILAMFLWLFLDLGIRFANPELLDELIPGDAPIQSAVALSLINVLINLLYFGAAYFFGDRAWASARDRAELEHRNAELAEQRAALAEQAVVLERIRIARELHDVVAHHVAVMGVQAGAARRVLRADPDGAERSLVAVEASARQAVDELQRMLGTLRSGPLEQPASAPSTEGLERLPELVDEAGSSGRSISFSSIGDPRPTPATVASALYRVAQEAITNSLKHAGRDTTIDVRLRFLDETIELEVTDTGGRPDEPAQGSNLGLVGMRERMAAVGGTLHTGTRARGGFVVRAAVPVGGTT
ncbi:sensor histidine kinase [Lysobacter korlensis]|uniref:histidine kinase n=1 Tax=Lysobacter korlensis TaxID=553636 RepID=A0ABV6RVG3_9GAMM